MISSPAAGVYQVHNIYTVSCELVRGVELRPGQMVTSRIDYYYHPLLLSPSYVPNGWLLAVLYV